MAVLQDILDEPTDIFSWLVELYKKYIHDTGPDAVVCHVVSILNCLLLRIVIEEKAAYLSVSLALLFRLSKEQFHLNKLINA